MSRQLLSECVRSLSQPRSQESSRQRLSGIFDDGTQTRQENNNNNLRHQRASSVSISNNNITAPFRDPTSLSAIHAQPITNPQEQIQSQPKSQQYPFPSSKAAIISQEDCNLDIESSCDLSGSYAQIDSPLAVANHPNIIYNQIFKGNTNAQQIQKPTHGSLSISATPPTTESANPLNIPCFKVDKTLSALSSRTSHPQELSQPRDPSQSSIQPSSSSLISLSTRTVFSFTRQSAVSFPKEIEQRCANLQILDISENRFKTVPSEIASFRQLKRLNISSNFIRILPTWLFEVLSLSELRASNNLLSDFPSNLFSQSDLQVLDLNKNRITFIPHAIGSLRNLHTLNIACNDFTVLPSSMRFLLDSSLSKLTLDWFKYCNPPLSVMQSTNDNHLQLFQPGQEVISPMKKLSQLLFRAEEKQKNITNSTRSSSTNAGQSENQDNTSSSNIPSYLKVPVLLSSKKQLTQQRPLSDRNHYVLSDRSSFQPEIIHNNANLQQGAYSHRATSRRDSSVSSPYVPLNVSSMSSADTSFASCNYSSIPAAAAVPGLSLLLEKMSKPIPILRDLTTLPTFGQLQPSACDYSFRQFLEEMSTKRFNPAIKLENNVTLLHVAAASEDLGAIEGLNQLNPQLKDALDDKSFSALAVAINEEKYFAAKKLLKLGANPSIGGGIFGTPLNIATIKGQIFLLADILAKEDLCVNTPDADGNTSIHYIMTVYSRDFESSEKILKLLLDAGCNPNVRNLDGWTPLHLAIRRSQFAAVQFAIQHNKRRSKGLDKNPKQIDGMFQKHPQNTQFFDFLAKGGDMKQSCLHISCLHNDVRMTKMLLESNEVDFFAMNSLNQTAGNLPPKGNMLSKYLKKYQREMLETDLLTPQQQNQQSQSILEQPKNAPRITKPIAISQGSINPSTMNTAGAAGSAGVIITSPKEQALGFNFKRKILIFNNKLEQKQPSRYPRFRQINQKGNEFISKEQSNQELTCTDTEENDDDDDNCYEDDAYSRDSCPEDSQATAPTDFDEHNHIKDIKSSKSGNLPSQIRTTNEIVSKNLLQDQTQRQQQLSQYHQNIKLQQHSINPIVALSSREVEQLQSRKENTSSNSNGQNNSNNPPQVPAASYRSSCSASGLLNKLIFCRQRTLPSDEQPEQKTTQNQKIDNNNILLLPNHNNNYHLASSRMKKRKTHSAMYHFVNGTTNNINTNTNNAAIDGNASCQVVQYIAGDEDNRMLMIPKLQGEITQQGANYQIELQKTIENILSVFESGAFQYKSSLEQSVMSVSEQFQQVFYLLKLFTQTNYQIMLQQLASNGGKFEAARSIFQGNNNTQQLRMLNQQRGNHISPEIIVNRMQMTLKGLLSSLNATPLDTFTLMQFVENKDQINSSNRTGMIANTQIKQEKSRSIVNNSNSISNNNNNKDNNNPNIVERPPTISRVSMKSNSVDSNPQSQSSSPEDSPASSSIALNLPFSNWSPANSSTQSSSPGDLVREFILSSLFKIAPLSVDDIPVIDTLEQSYCRQGVQYSEKQQLSSSSVILAFECFQARAAILSRNDQKDCRILNNLLRHPDSIHRNGGSFSARGHSDSLDHYDSTKQRLDKDQQQQQIQTARDIVNRSCDIITNNNTKQQIQLKLIEKQQQQQLQQQLQIQSQAESKQQQSLHRSKQQPSNNKEVKGTYYQNENSSAGQNSTACSSNNISNNLSYSFIQHTQLQQQEQRSRVSSNPPQAITVAQSLGSSSRQQQTSVPASSSQSSASPYFLNLLQLPSQTQQPIDNNSSRIYSKPNSAILSSKPPRAASISNIHQQFNSKENDTNTFKDNNNYVIKKETMPHSSLNPRVYRSNSITYNHSLNNSTHKSSSNALNKSNNP